MTPEDFQKERRKWWCEVYLTSFKQYYDKLSPARMADFGLQQFDERFKTDLTNSKENK